MQTHRLIPHPSTPPDQVRAVSVETIVTADDLLLTFVVDGAEALLIPDWVQPERADDLWQTTCFELFLKPADSDGYWEFNFSPSTQWAAYRFDRHREGMRNAALSIDPHIERGDGQSGYLIEVDVDLSDVPSISCRMGLSAVIEEKSGRKSYWALAHPPGDPDFHNGDCFALTLPPAS